MILHIFRKITLKNISATVLLLCLDILLAAFELEVLTFLLNALDDCVAGSLLLDFRVLGHAGFGHGFEGLGDILACFGTDLENFDALAITELLDFLFGNLPRLAIEFIAQQVDLDIGLAVLLDLGQPEVVDVLE